MTEKRITSRDVARLAGVSQTTVSYVLSGDPHAIGAETRARVLEAARALGYHPDESARTLRRGHSLEIYMIGMWQVLNLFSLTMMTEMDAEIHRLGYTLVGYSGSAETKTEREERLLQIVARRPLGLIGAAMDFSEEQVRLMRSKGVKGVVLVSLAPCDYAPTMALPVRQAARLVGEHLRERGHRCAAMAVPEEDFEIYPAGERLAGLREAGFHEDDPGMRLLALRMHSSLAGARRWVADLLRLPQRPTAIYGYNDERAIMLLRALQERGLRVPQDIALVGTDNLPFGELVTPSITSVQFDPQGMVRRCVEALHLQIQDQPLPPDLLTGLQPRLVIRESS